MMASVHKCVAASLLIATARLCSAGEFLNAADVDNSLEEELVARDYNKERIQDFVKALATSFAALPKNEAGNLQHQTARYILHRFFVQRHGWYVKGLEPKGDTFHTSASKDTLKDWVPSYLLDKLEKRLQHKGLDLNDLSVLAAAIDDLAAKEAGNLVDDIFSQFKAKGLVNANGEPSLDDAVLSYVTSFLSNEFWDAKTAARSRFQFVREYHQWNQTKDWYKAIEQAHVQSAAASLSTVKQIALDIGANYGAMNDQRCSELKGALLGMWAKGNATGRVRLVDFYRMGLDTQWDLVEKKDYLQTLGAIDDSNASSPLVIIPNYLTSRPNCLKATNLYEVCCRNECEDLLGHLERSIAAPEAEPAHIMTLISALGSETVQVPRLEGKLEPLAVRLKEIADAHGGKVKLHGRLFAQWMHHAYPSECPYPHEAGTVNPSSADEWLDADVELSEAERKQMVEGSCSPEEAAAEWTGELPWSVEEELLHDSAAEAAIDVLYLKLLIVFAFVGVGIGAAVEWRIRPDIVDKLAEKISWKQVLLAVLSLLGVALNVVNWVLLLVMVCVGILLPRLLSMGSQQQKKHVEKCVV